jgi:anti-anti-sigma factor
MTLPKAHRLAVDFVEDFTIIEFLDEEISQVFCVSDDVQEIGSQVDRLVESLRPKKLLLDFARVEFMASFMQAFVVGLKKRLERAGGRLVLCGMTDQVDQSFRITNLHRVFEVYLDRDEALELAR